MIKGRNSRTGTVHIAVDQYRDYVGKKHSKPIGLSQACGMPRNQHVLLSEVPEDTPLTCKRCIKAYLAESGRVALAEAAKKVPATTTTKETPVAKRQERTARANKKATEKAEKVVAKTTKRVKASTDNTTELAGKVKELRERGEAWWRIGHLLGLPGSADNVAQGKAGAAQARKIYKKAFGALPERPKATGNGKPRKVERAERARKGEPLFDAETTEEEIKSRLSGKTISWSIDLGRLTGGDNGAAGYAEQEATVHPDYLLVEEGKNGERCVRFRELEAGHRSGATRTVRLAAIHTIR